MDFSTVLDSQINTHAGVDATISAGTLITASATANAKGAWAPLIASTARPANWLLISVGAAASATADSLIDIGIGAASAEQVLISNLLFTIVGSNRELVHTFLLPIAIPSSARIAARVQSSVVSHLVRVGARLFANGLSHGAPLGRVETVGADTATSGGTLIDPGATANTKGAWAVLTSASAKSWKALYVAFGNRLKTTRGTQRWSVDIGISTGPEQVIVPDLFLGSSSANTALLAPPVGLIPVSVPAGARVSARAASTDATAGTREIDVVVYGVN